MAMLAALVAAIAEIDLQGVDLASPELGEGSADE
jgi:hypothetical protein